MDETSTQPRELKDLAFSRASVQSHVIHERKMSIMHRSLLKSETHYSCRCSVCDTQIKGRLLLNGNPAEQKDRLADALGQPRSFTWLLETLCSISSKHPLRLPIPETIIFRNSKPELLVQPNKQGCLKMYRKGERMKLHELMKMFTITVRGRKKSDTPVPKTPIPKTPVPRTASPNENNRYFNYGKEIALLRYMANSRENDNISRPEDEEGILRVMQENEFIDLMYERAGSNVWKTISYMQTVVKCRGGIGETFVINLYSPEKGEGYDDEDISDETDIDPHLYCLKFAQKIYYLLDNFGGYEPLRMQLEFMRDDNGMFWLTYGSRISVRESKNSKARRKRAMATLSQDEKLQLMVDLDYHLKEHPVNCHLAHYADMMKNYYRKLKSHADIDRVLQAQPPRYYSEETILKLQNANLKPGVLFSKDRQSHVSADNIKEDPRNSHRTRARLQAFRAWSRERGTAPTRNRGVRRMSYLSSAPLKQPRPIEYIRDSRKSIREYLDIYMMRCRSVHILSFVAFVDLILLFVKLGFYPIVVGLSLGEVS
jgi:hypothetical protein